MVVSTTTKGEIAMIESLRGLDAWITREPEYQAELITISDEPTMELWNIHCDWCAKRIGWHDGINADYLHEMHWMSNYWQLDEDAEHCVCVECQDRADAYEAQQDEEMRRAYEECIANGEVW